LAADSATDITTANLLLSAGTAIGEAVNHLDTQVINLSTKSTTGSTYINETDGAIVTTVTLTAKRIQTTGAATDLTADSQSGLTSGGTTLLETGGALILDGNVTSTGNIRLTTAASLTGSGNITSTSGHITLLATTVISLTGGDVITGGSGTIDLEAGTFIILGNSSDVLSGSGDIRMVSSASSAITLGGIISTTGNVSITAAGAIIDGDGDGTTVDISASGLRLTAGTAIGTGTNAVETSVITLSAKTSGGGIFLLESTGVTVGSTSATIQKVGTGNNLTATSDGSQEDLSATGGAIVLQTTDGFITVGGGTDTGGISATGNILLKSRELIEGTLSDITLNALVTSVGSISIISKDSIIQSAVHGDITAATSKTIDLQADAAITMGDGALTQASGGVIRYLATTGDITVGEITTGATGTVVITATAGSILDLSGDTTAVDITTSALQLTAGDSIGTIGSGSANPLETLVASISAKAGSSMNISETDGLTVGTVPAANHDIVGSDGAATSTATTSQSGLTTTSGATILTTGGSLLLSGDVTSGSNILLAVTGSLTGAGNITSSGSGHITATTTAAIDITGDITTHGAGSIDLEAGSFITLASATSDATSGSGDIRMVTATGDITIGKTIGTTGDVSLTATAGSIVDGDADGISGTVDILATGLRLSAGTGIGGGTNHIETTVTILSGHAGSGGLYLYESDGLIVGDTVVNVEKVTSDNSLTATSDGLQSDIIASGSGNIVIRTATGNITLNDGTVTALGAPGLDGTAVTSASGTILLQSGVTGVGSILGNADIVSGSGALSLVAKTDIIFSAGADITSTSGTIDLQTTTGVITLSRTSNIATTTSGDISLIAKTDLTLGGLISTSGSINLNAITGSIIDGDGAGDSSVDLHSTGLILTAGSIIGSSTNAIETTVGTVSVSAGGSVFILESNGLTLGTASTTITRVKDGSTADATVGTSQSNITTTAASNGSIIIRTDSGNLALAASHTITADGSGNILLEAGGVGSFNAGATTVITSGSGHITILGADTINFSDNADISTSGSIDLEAGLGTTLGITGTITLSSTGSDITSNASDIRLLAKSDITLGGVITATLGSVSITSTNGAIKDGDADGIDGTVDIVANSALHGLRMSAATGIGTAAQHIETTITNLTATTATGGIFVIERTDGLTIGDVSVTISRVGFDNALTTAIEVKQSDVTTGAGAGSIILRTTSGSIYLTDGTAQTNGSAVSASGTGNILIVAGGDGSDIIADADVTSGSGNITLTAADSITLNSGVDVVTGTPGTISLDAQGGLLTMDGTASVTASDSLLRLNAFGDITVGNLTAANVSLVSDSGAIINAAGSSTNVTATNLRLWADDAIGTAGRHLTTSTATVSAYSTGTSSTGIYLNEDTAITVGTVAVSVTEYSKDGGTSAVNDAAQSNLVTGTSGNIVLVTTAGSITLNDSDATAAIGTAVSANGSASILLSAGGVGSDILASGSIESSTGHITLTAADDINLGTSVVVSTGTPGTISLDAQGGALAMAGTATVTATGSTLRLNAFTDLTVGNLSAITVSLISDSGAIINAAGSLKNVTATNLRLQADDTIGTAGRHLTTDVSNVTAASSGTDSGGIYLSEDSAITVTGVAASVTEFTATAGISTVADATQSDLTAGGSGAIILVTTAGSITLTDGSDSDGSTVVAAGSGSILILAQGSGSDISSAADITSGSGHITMTAADSIDLGVGVDVTTAATGTISLDAQGLNSQSGA
ncbi:MAG: beta strand repeat-containing protein, partial [Desulfuromonadaceae bacterium]